MKTQRIHRYRTAAWLFFCLTAPVFAANLMFWSSVIPGAEPFTTWTAYLMAWLLAALCTTGICAVPSVFVCIFASNPKRWTITAALGGVWWIWLFIPVVAAWSVASLLLASYAPGFDGTLYSGNLPPTWKGPLTWMSNGVIGFAIVLAAAVVVIFSMHRRMKHAAERSDNSCPNCGYSMAGLTASVCPECGRMTHRETDAPETGTTAKRSPPCPASPSPSSSTSTPSRH